MKKILFVLIAVSLVYALTKTSPPYRFTANTAARASEVNANNDTLDHTIDKIIDTVNNAVMRFNPTATSRDSVLKFVRIDTIKSNPWIDSIQGNPVLDSLRVLTGIRVEYSLSADSILTNGIRCDNSISTDSILFNGARGTDGITAPRGIFDSIQIGGGSWIKQAAIGGFVMTLTNTGNAAIVMSDSSHYYLFNDNVSLSLALDTTIVDSGAIGTVYKFKTSTFPNALRPTTAKTIKMPMTISGGGGAAVGSSVYFKIPISTAAPCTLLVETVGTENTTSLVQSNISYSLN
jgi:hypothetical protein